jgi:S1-C subfamily serine protease
MIALVAAVTMTVAAVGVSRLPLHGSRPTLAAAPLTQAPVVPSPGATSASGPLVAGQADAIAAAVDPGIVDVNTTLGYRGGAGAGTGMILTTSGAILTNNHVVEGATSITVTLVDTGRTYPATVVGTDATHDVAVIQIHGVSGLKPIPMGDSSAVTVGDGVVAIGNALGAGGTPAVVTGNVTALDQTITVTDDSGGNTQTLSGLIQTDAPLQPGDSGGPLLNRSGQVIGIDTAASAGRRFRAGASVGLAIPINQARAIAAQIQAGQGSATVHIGLPGFLGVQIASTQRSAARGAVVAGVVAGGPAAAAGLAAGDIITSVDGQTVTSPDALSAATGSHHPGDKVTVRWTDTSGAQHRATVVLATGPAN